MAYLTVLQTTNVLVTGLKWISDSFSVPFPQYAPLLVLHDPPGGIVILRVNASSTM
jgi:hypothetical protein